MPPGTERWSPASSPASHPTRSSCRCACSAVRVVAPGSNIRSTYYDGGYATWSGTSFAAPFVSAQAATLLSAFAGVPNVNVISIIRNSATSVDNVNPDYKGLLGNGIINIG